MGWFVLVVFLRVWYSCSSRVGTGGCSFPLARRWAEGRYVGIRFLAGTHLVCRNASHIHNHPSASPSRSLFGVTYLYSRILRASSDACRRVAFPPFSIPCSRTTAFCILPILAIFLVGTATKRIHPDGLTDRPSARWRCRFCAAPGTWL